MTHISSHIGDEYQMRTGRERVNYTREELSVGADWRWSPSWRAYGETGVAYYRGDSALEPWRIQSGVEWESGLGPCSAHFACYAAADISTMQERGWRVDKTGSFGILVQCMWPVRHGFTSNGTTAVQPRTNSYRHGGDAQPGYQDRFVAVRRRAV